MFIFHNVSTKLSTNSENKKNKNNLNYEIYKESLLKHIINIDEVKRLSKNDQTARMAVWRMSHNNKLLRIKGGLYAGIPAEIDSSNFEINRYILADRLFGVDGCLAFHSALEVHGVGYSIFNTLYYLMMVRKSPFEIQGIRYQPVWTKELFGMTKIYIEDVQVNVTDRERTFLDCLRRLDLCGGVEEFFKSVEGFKLLDESRLMEYLGKFDEQSLYQRAGFAFSVLKGKIRVSDELLDELKCKVGKNHYYLVPGKTNREGKLVKEWNILIPKNFEEMIQFA